MVTRKAYHRLLLPDGTLVEGPVVVSFDEKGNLLEWHHLQQEEARTEWVGGVKTIEYFNPIQ